MSLPWFCIHLLVACLRGESLNCDYMVSSILDALRGFVSAPCLPMSLPFSNSVLCSTTTSSLVDIMRGREGHRLRKATQALTTPSIGHEAAVSGLLDGLELDCHTHGIQPSSVHYRPPSRRRRIMTFCKKAVRSWRTRTGISSTGSYRDDNYSITSGQLRLSRLKQAMCGL